MSDVIFSVNDGFYAASADFARSPIGRFFQGKPGGLIAGRRLIGGSMLNWHTVHSSRHSPHNHKQLYRPSQPSTDTAGLTVIRLKQAN